MILLDTDRIYELYEEYKKDNVTTTLDNLCTEITEVYASYNDTVLTSLVKKIDYNLNFYRGNHWISYSDSSNRYESFGVNKYNEDVPQCVTNYVASECDMVIALLTKSREVFRVIENSDSSEDRNKARIAEIILDGNYFLNNERMLKQLYVTTGILCGTAYRKDFYNYETKRLESKILSPLQIIPDLQNGTTDINDGHFFMEFGFYLTSTLRNKYSKTGKGYTGLGEDIEDSDNKNLQLQYLQRLQNSSADNETPKNYSVLIETYIKPNHKYKNGLFIVSTDSKILYISEDVASTQFGGKFWLPYTEYKYKLDLFSNFGTSLPEVLIPLNKDINKIDSLLMLNRATMAAPKFMVPKGTLADDEYVDGRPGQRIDYNTGYGDKPSFEYGKPLDNSVLQERQQRVQDLMAMSGTNEILRGVRPQGVSTASGLNLLLEQSYSKFDNTVARLENSMSMVYTKVINIVKNCYKGDRKDYINKVKTLNSSSTKVAIDDFFKSDSDIGNNIDVRVEPGSMMPKSRVMEQNNIKEVGAMGVFGPLDPMQNPVGNKYFLSKFDLGKFKTPTNNDTTRALWENDLIRNSEFSEVEVMPIDDNVIHFKVLNQEIKRPDFYDNNSQEVVDYFWRHLCEHYQELMPQEMQMLKLTPKQMQELDAMSVKLGAIEEEELMQRKQEQMMMEQQAAQEQAIIGNNPNEQNVPLQDGVTPDSSYMGADNSDFFSGEQV